MSDVTVYTTAWCRYCHAAKRLLDDRDIGYKEIDIESWTEPWERLYTTTGGSSVPQIVVGGDVIGGYDELRALVRGGKLESQTGAPR